MMTIVTSETNPIAVHEERKVTEVISQSHLAFIIEKTIVLVIKLKWPYSLAIKSCVIPTINVKKTTNRMKINKIINLIFKKLLNFLKADSYSSIKDSLIYSRLALTTKKIIAIKPI